MKNIVLHSFDINLMKRLEYHFHRFFIKFKFDETFDKGLEMALEVSYL